MRWGVRVLLCFAVACGGGSGVDIDIFVPDGATVTRVELWVAYDPCTNCPSGVAWTNAPVDGDIYYLRDEAVIKAEQSGDRWVIHLDALPDYTDPRGIVIVGFDADKVTAVKAIEYPHIPSSSVAIWQVYLHAAAPATTDVATPPADPNLDHRVHVWARQPTPELPAPTGCLVSQEWNGSRWDVGFIVPKSDPDCDGYPIEKECNQFWYQYKSQGSCVSNQIVPDAPMPCVLGYSPCEDGVSGDKTCGHELNGLTSCVPDAICAKCMGQIPAEACAPSAARDAHVANTLFHYDCEVDAASDGINCLDQHVAVQLPHTASLCSTVSLHYVDKPFSEPQTALMYGTPGAPVKFTTVLRNGTTDPCVVDIYWFGVTTPFKAGLLFLLEVGYDNGTRAFYPIEMKQSTRTILCTQVMLTYCLPGGPANDGVTACSRY